MKKGCGPLRHAVDSRVIALTRIGILLLLAASFAGAADEVINPYPRAVLSQQLLKAWEFDTWPDGWSLEKHLKPGDVEPGLLSLVSEGIDPILTSPPVAIEPRAVVKLRMRTLSPGPGQIFWVGQDHPGASEASRSEFSTEADGDWHEYTIECPFDYALRQFRVDPGVGPGEVDIDWIRVEQKRLHPLEIESVTVGKDSVVASVRNHAKRAIAAVVNGTLQTEIPAGQAVPATIPRKTGSGLITQEIRVEAEDLPPVVRVTTIRGDETVEADGGAIFVNDAVMLGPLVARDGKPISLDLIEKHDSEYLFESESEGIRLSLEISGNEIRYDLRSRDPVEGPVVRIRGGLEQGLLSGVEHLGKGERSSSKLDLRGPEHIRFAPDLSLITMPLAAFVTTGASVAMTWQDPAQTRTAFATPNFFEGTDDHRMALVGRDIRATIRVGAPFPGERLEDLILWAVRERGGLPARPEPPRSVEGQLRLCLDGFEKSVVAGEDGGWYHAVVPGHRNAPEEPKWFADHLSTIFRITGEVPEHPEIVYGGGHVENGAIYFVSGQTQQWLTIQRNRVKSLIETQQPDGSYRYGGENREGHFEDTSSGHCARPAQQLLAFAKATGDGDALEAGLKTLEFMKRFRTPRGAQVWECPLHAPDILASAYLVKAYALGFELTGNEEYRDLAVRWALSGVPYVYQWSNKPVMRYATIATLCATHWEAPVWIGRPVQWCGLVYADALLDLAPHDRTLDWPKLAEGILISAEQQIYTEGQSIGLLADSLTLESQQLHPFDINPSTVADLRLRIEGRPAGLFFAGDGDNRVVSPFPVRFENETLTFEPSPSRDFQILIGGERVIDVKPGQTSISLNE